MIKENLFADFLAEFLAKLVETFNKFETNAIEICTFVAFNFAIHFVAKIIVKVNSFVYDFGYALIIAVRIERAWSGLMAFSMRNLPLALRCRLVRKAALPKASPRSRANALI